MERGGLVDRRNAAAPTKTIPNRSRARGKNEAVAFGSGHGVSRMR
jgi:hypothetical protein